MASSSTVREISAWAIKDVPGMVLQIFSHDDNLAADQKHERFFSPGFLECVLHYKDRIRFGIFVAQFASEETVTPSSDTHRFFLFAHDETVEAVNVVLTGRMLQFWARYRHLTTGVRSERYLTLTTTWEG